MSVLSQCIVGFAMVYLTFMSLILTTKNLISFMFFKMVPISIAAGMFIILLNTGVFSNV